MIDKGKPIFMTSKHYPRNNRSSMKPKRIFEKLKQSDYFSYQIKPMLIVFRYIGVFPVDFKTDGLPRFHLLSFIFVYSVSVLVVNSYSVYSNIHALAKGFLSHKGNFVYLVVNFTQMIGMFIVLISPPLMWLDTNHCLAYMEKWNHFQDVYSRTTESCLSLSQRKIIMRGAIVSIISALLATSSLFFQEEIDIWRAPCAFTVATLIAGNGGFRLSILRCLISAGESLNHNFKLGIKEGRLTPKMLSDYRHLWLQLSHLVSETGNMLGKATILVTAAYLFVLTAALYGWLAGILNKQENVYQSMGMAVSFIGGLFILFMACSRSHETTSVVETTIKEELNLITPNSVSDEVYEEVKFFQQSVLLNPPVISLLGFVDVNRGMFSAYVSALITYLIVLLQLGGVGQSDDNNINTTSPTI